MPRLGIGEVPLDRARARRARCAARCSPRATRTAPPSSRGRCPEGRSSRPARRPARAAGRCGRASRAAVRRRRSGGRAVPRSATRRCAASSRASRRPPGRCPPARTRTRACSRGSSPGGTSTEAVHGRTSRRRSATARRHSGSPAARSESSFTPNAMWRCSSWAIRSIPSRNPGSRSRSCRYDVMKCCPGLGERRLDHDVVERDRSGQTRQRRVLAQLVRHPVEPVEHLPEAPRELWPDRLQSAADGAVTEVADLVHEAVEEHGVARLVDLLRGEEVLLLLGRRGGDVRRQPVGDGVLAPEEERVVPKRRAALELGHLLVPLAAVLGEVDLRRAPVALLPACVQVRVADLLRDGRHHVTHPLVCLYR